MNSRRLFAGCVDRGLNVETNIERARRARAPQVAALSVEMFGAGTPASPIDGRSKVVVSTPLRGRLDRIITSTQRTTVISNALRVRKFRKRRKERQQARNKNE